MSSWSDTNTRHLITAYGVVYTHLSANGEHKLKQKDWDAVSKELKKLAPSLHRTGLQCSHKIQKIRKSYRDDDSTFKFFTEISAVLNPVLEEGPQKLGPEEPAAVAGLEEQLENVDKAVSEEEQNLRSNILTILRRLRAKSRLLDGAYFDYKDLRPDDAYHVLSEYAAQENNFGCDESVAAFLASALLKSV